MLISFGIRILMENRVGEKIDRVYIPVIIGLYKINGKAILEENHSMKAYKNIIYK